MAPPKASARLPPARPRAAFHGQHGEARGRTQRGQTATVRPSPDQRVKEPEPARLQPGGRAKGPCCPRATVPDLVWCPETR